MSDREWLDQYNHTTSEPVRVRITLDDQWNPNPWRTERVDVRVGEVMNCWRRSNGETWFEGGGGICALAPYGFVDIGPLEQLAAALDEDESVD